MRARRARQVLVGPTLDPDTARHHDPDDPFLTGTRQKSDEPARSRARRIRPCRWPSFDHGLQHPHIKQMSALDRAPASPQGLGMRPGRVSSCVPWRLGVPDSSSYGTSGPGRDRARLRGRARRVRAAVAPSGDRRVTGSVEELTIPCGSTREAVCPPCAAKARRLRIQQCAEGWHLAEDPLTQASENAHVGPDLDDENKGDGTRRVRSTRRRSEVPDLPRLPVEPRTIGRTFTAPDGTTYRPSMFVTLTLGSHGKVIPAGADGRAPGAGAPLSPARYDYRRAAIEAMYFTRLFDRPNCSAHPVATRSWPRSSRVTPMHSTRFAQRSRSPAAATVERCCRGLDRAHR